MARMVEKLKRAGSSLWYGEKYAHFDDRIEPKTTHDKPSIPFASHDSPIQELGVLVGGSGAVITGMGAALELVHIASNEIGQMTLYGGLGGIAIGGAIYAYGKLAE